MLDLESVGNLSLTADSNMLIFFVLRKQKLKKQTFGPEINDFVHIYFTQETHDYQNDKITVKEYPWKLCTAQDFEAIDKREKDGKSGAVSAVNLFETWDGYTLICPDYSDDDPIHLSGDRGSSFSNHMQLNIRMCNKTKNENCKDESIVKEYVKDLQVDTWIAEEKMDFMNFDGRPTYHVQE